MTHLFDEASDNFTYTFTAPLEHVLVYCFYNMFQCHQIFIKLSFSFVTEPAVYVVYPSP